MDEPEQPREWITIRGAKQNNLKNVDVSIPSNQLTVITGVSGSGKSSLAFDTLYAEGQRRYVESLSAYARQFLERINKPQVDEITGHQPGYRDPAKERIPEPAINGRDGDRNLRLPATPVFADRDHHLPGVPANRPERHA